MHRVLFYIGNFPVYSYGVLMALAVFLAYFLVKWRNKTLKVATDEDISDFYVWLILTGIAGARLAYVLLHFSEYSSNILSIFNLRAGGLALHGALIAGVFVFIYFAKKRKISPMKLLDLFAPSVLLGIAVGRIGCFMNGCCLGVEAPAGIGVIFADAGYTMPRYPTQIYEMILDFVAIFVLLYWEKHKRFEGEVMIGAFSLYSVIRFILEMFRESPPRFFGLSIAQYLSIFLFFLTLVWILKSREKGDVNIFSRERSKRNASKKKGK